ncbi:MAG: hypothetical protein LBO66_01635 [Deltaproteobacteria bacterium]|jgi:hypothetical protein|nr:hypothetical protein [Deltaproteobacteria bacterium]
MRGYEAQLALCQASVKSLPLNVHADQKALETRARKIQLLTKDKETALAAFKELSKGDPEIRAWVLGRKDTGNILKALWRGP